MRAVLSDCAGRALNQSVAEKPQMERICSLDTLLKDHRFDQSITFFRNLRRLPGCISYCAIPYSKAISCVAPGGIYKSSLHQSVLAMGMEDNRKDMLEQLLGQDAEALGVLASSHESLV